MASIPEARRPSTPIHVEVWIASRLLTKSTEVFTKQELVGIIEREFNDKRKGISTHISSVCVANKPPNHATVYDYLYSVSRNKYRILSPEDEIHPDRPGSRKQPDLDDIPEKYLYLADKLIDFKAELRTERVLLSRDASRPSPLFQDEKPKGIQLDELYEHERLAIDKTLLMMAYNPSCARIFSSQANLQIKNAIYSGVKRLVLVTDQVSFNSVHRDILEEIINSVENKRARKVSKTITYGQAQKGLNVFLKVYVDWANLPDPGTANTLRPLLHCPLDSIVMNSIKREEPGVYYKYGSPPCSMRGINSYEQYINWQKVCDEIIRNSRYSKRTLIDILWFLGGQKEKSG